MLNASSPGIRKLGLGFRVTRSFTTTTMDADLPTRCSGRIRQSAASPSSEDLVQGFLLRGFVLTHQGPRE